VVGLDSYGLDDKARYEVPGDHTENLLGAESFREDWIKTRCRGSDMTRRLLYTED